MPIRSEWRGLEFFGRIDGVETGPDGVVLEDYGKGMLRQEVVTRVLEICSSKGLPSGYDPKDNHELNVSGITFATPNRKETFQVANVQDRTPDADPLTDPHLL